MSRANRVRLEVTFFNHQTISREVTSIGWKVSTSRRVLVIGHGVPRMEIPLDNVLCWQLTRIGLSEEGGK